MTKEKKVSLTKYLETLKDQLSSPTPKKHENHPESYKNFLRLEIDIVARKLEEAKLEGSTK